MSDLIKKLKPPKINFIEEWQTMTTNSYQETFDSWYTQHITPLFENAKLVTGWEDVFHVNPNNLDGKPAVRALVIGIEPIDQAVSKDALVSYLRSPKRSEDYERELADRIERYEVKS